MTSPLPSPPPARPRRRRLWLRILLLTPPAALLLALAVVFGCSWWMTASTSRHVYHDISLVPPTRVALVMGTSKKTAGGRTNLFFKNRIQAAADLYHAGKVRRLLVSGSNPSRNYDEPTDMMNALLALGVPRSAITRDYAGRRTLDSMIRAREIFGLDTFIVVTDEFHTYRALFIGQHHGIHATAFASAKVDARLSLKTRLREKFANLKAILDLYILDTRPQRLGKKEPLPED